MLFRSARPLLVVTTFVSAGCACPIVRTVVPLHDERPRALESLGNERRLSLEECKELCGGESNRVIGCTLHPMASKHDERDTTERALVCETRWSCPGGRAPAGVELSAPLRAASPEGAFWAGVARMEAVSIGSFLRLAHELSAHGAPSTLVERALRAAGEEYAHATAMATLAAQLGAELPAVPEVALEVRELDDVALENEVEGCVHERWSAVVVAHQAAALPKLRARLAPIAVEEAAHAELSLDLAHWFRVRGGPGLARRLDAAQERARWLLLKSLEQETANPALGMPSLERAGELAAAALA